MIDVNIMLTVKQRDSLERILGMSQTDILDMPNQFMVELVDQFECELLIREVVARGDSKIWQLQITQRLKEVFKRWINTMSWPDNVALIQEGRRYIIDDWFKKIEYDIHSNRLIKSEQAALSDIPKYDRLKNEKDKPYFNVFNDVVDKNSQQTGTTDIVNSNLAAADGKRIVLAKNRNSDYTRIVRAMIQDGYFCHADKSAVTATEVGEMMLKLVGVGTEWKSMLQKAFSRDNPLKTFDNLRDAAQSYWQERAKISN